MGFTLSKEAVEKVAHVVRQVLAESPGPAKSNPFGRPLPNKERFFAKIVNAGPNAESDYTDERHWFKRVLLSTAGNSTAENTWGDPASTDAEYLHDTLSFVPAAATNSHVLPAGTIVEVERVYDNRAGTYDVHYVSFSVWHPAPESFWAKLTGSQLVSGATNRWEYSWVEQERTATGWQDKSGGRSSTADEDDFTNSAYNSIEANNDGSGVEGNGIDHDGVDYPAGFAMIPADTGNPVVRMWLEYLADGSPVYSFEYVNAEDGTCDEPVS